MRRARGLARRLPSAGPLALSLSLSLSLSVVGIGCLGSLESLVEGTVEVETAEFDAWRYSPDRCFSGEPLQFFGVDLIDGEPEIGRITRIVQDPVEGFSVAINVPGEDIALVFTGDGCERFEIEIMRENSRVNEIWNMSGFADIQCETPGVRLDIDASFENCH